MKTYKQASEPITPQLLVNYLKALLLGALCGMVFIITTDLNCRGPQKILEPVPPSMYNRTTPTITPTPTIVKKAIVPYKKYLTVEAAQARTKIIPIIHAKWSTEDDRIAFDNILKVESGYRLDAINEIGACGIGQSLPCSKMNCPLDYSEEALHCQVTWVHAYIERRYGTPSAAWDFWQNKAPTYDFNKDGVADGNNWY